jgi:hypothetical protein
VKRIAWESRPVEHRTVPADQRLAGASVARAPEAVQAKTSVPAAPASTPVLALVAPAIVAEAKRAEADGEKSQEKKIAVTGAAMSGIDRAAIARVVETMLAEQGIARGSGAPKSTLTPQSAAAPAVSPAVKTSASPSTIAAEIADRLFGPSAKARAVNADGPSSTLSAATKSVSAPVALTAPPDSAMRPEPPAKVPVEIQVFVSENDVRRAMTRSEKIFIGRKTILTPSARDLGVEHEVFVETEAGSLR